MLVPTSFQPLANAQSCFMGVTVMGGVVNQFAQALVNLSHCKFLGSANYTIAKPTDGLLAGTYVNTNWTAFSAGLNKSSKVYNFFYASTPLSEWIGFIFQYVATRESSSNSPQITFRIKTTGGTIISKAVLFTYPEHLTINDENADFFRPNLTSSGATFYDPPSGTTGTDSPRPLYIPLSNRGDMLLLEVEVEDCDLLSISFFDFYQAEVTP